MKKIYNRAYSTYLSKECSEGLAFFMAYSALKDNRPARGIVGCEIHGHHNPHNMLVSGEYEKLKDKYLSDIIIEYEKWHEKNI